MGLGLADGGHLCVPPRRYTHVSLADEAASKIDRTHGAYTPKRKISASSIYFQSLPYQVDPKTGLIDYETLEKNAVLFKPRILICGASAYPRDWDYARLRKIADLNGSYLMYVFWFHLRPASTLQSTHPIIDSKEQLTDPKCWVIGWTWLIFQVLLPLKFKMILSNTSILFAPPRPSPPFTACTEYTSTNTHSKIPPTVTRLFEDPELV